MFNAYEEVRINAAALLLKALSAESKPFAIACPMNGAPAGTALPFLTGTDASAMACAVNKELSAPDCPYASILRTTESAGGYLTFSLTDDYYTYAMERAIGDLPPAVPITDPQTREEYALLRMQMLSRKQGHACPADPSVQNALWLALGIPERLNSLKPLSSILERACEALLSMGSELSKREQTELRANAGRVGECASRLIYAGFLAKTKLKRG